MRFLDGKKIREQRYVLCSDKGYLCKDNHDYWVDDEYNKHTLVYHTRKGFENFLAEAERQSKYDKENEVFRNFRIVKIKIKIEEIKEGE